MLQQTTSRAVIPHFEAFIKKFPSVDALARAKTEDVLEAWAGLGYYSRARNLHKASQQLAAEKSFPQNFEKLLEFPGFGPYTSRAVASLAFEQPVGVVDGNTIRVMSRWTNWAGEWWRPKARQDVQEFVDRAAAGGQPSVVNQAMMELGATICTPQSPTCLLCPIKGGCLGYKQGAVEELPLKKSKRESELWVWQAEVHKKNGQIALVKNTHLPFLKGQWILPGAGQRVTKKPAKYNYVHTITHYKIYVRVQAPAKPQAESLNWVKASEIKKWCPVSLVEKALQV